MTTMERVCNLVMKLKKEGLRQEHLKPEALLVKDLKFDSLDNTELLVLTEEEFGLEIEPADLQSLTDIRSAVEYIDKRLAQ